MKISKQFTQRSEKSLDQYFMEISKISMLSPEEEVELVIKMKRGSEGARNKLVNANLRFVVSVAKQYQNQGLPLMDLINEGNLGLIRATRKFDETRGFKFISYAVWWIRQGVTQAIAEQSRIVHLPLNIISDLRKIHRASKDFELEYDRKPSSEELAEILEMPLDTVTHVLDAYRSDFSIDAPIKHGENDEQKMIDVLPDINQLPPDEFVSKESLSIEIRNLLSILTDREKKILAMTFGIGIEHKATLETIGETFNLTRERVRQIKEEALRKLRKSPEVQKLLIYLE
jgi:RNA polymerase primary sigma factor